MFNVKGLIAASFRSLGTSHGRQLWTVSTSENKGVSNVRNKLKYFIETGQIIRKTLAQVQRQNRLIKSKKYLQFSKNVYSPQKALLVLKHNYENKLQNDDGSIIDVFKLSPKELNISDAKSLQIFNSLMKVKKITRKPTDRKLILLLLGSSVQQLMDPYLVTQDTLKLLHRDQADDRASYLARLAGDGGVVAMNSILQWHLERGDVKSAFRSFNDRKKWKIPENNHTFVILFSGLAKCHEWGKVPDSLAETCVEIFQKFRQTAAAAPDEYKCSIEHFNACLSVVVKNYSDGQQYAWSFFDELISDPTNKAVPMLVPDSQTFAILLNGIKKFHQHQAVMIQDHRKLSYNEKTAQLLANQRDLISTAKLILNKVITAATPPVPPTKEQAEKNPALLDEYKKKMNRILVDIDPVFATTFITCFINNIAGTGVGGSSHYVYVQEGLQYLTAWCPEVQQMFANQMAGEVSAKAPDLSLGVLLSPSDEIKARTDARIAKALAQAPPISSVDKQTVNPLVQFPPPATSKNKKRAIFSGKEKHLVDFTRPTHADVRLYTQAKQYKSSKGKYGVKLPAGKVVTLEKRSGINRFLLMTALDGLISLGRHQEFYAGVWYILNRWGGIYIDTEALIKVLSVRGLAGVIDNKPHYYQFGQPDIVPSSIPLLSQRLSLTASHNPEAVDMMLVENFIYKIHENFDGKLPPSVLINDIVRALLGADSNMSGTLQVRDKTVKILFSVLMNELFHFSNSNYNRGVISTRAKNVPNNTPKKSITKQQLRRFLPSLVSAITNTLMYDHQVFQGNRKSMLANYYTEAYNKLVNRLYGTTWIDVEKGSREYIDFHKQIIQSGILMYKPAALIDPREYVVYSTPIQRSMEIVYDSLKERNDLNRNENKLMLNLRGIFTLKSDTKDGNKVLTAYARKVYVSISEKEGADKGKETGKEKEEEI